jgi:hypothetical protein
VLWLEDRKEGVAGVSCALFFPAQSRISSANHVIVGLAMLLFSQIDLVSSRPLQ